MAKDPHDASAWSLASRTARAGRLPDEALAHVKKAVALEPTDLELRPREASCLLELGRHDEANAVARMLDAQRLLEARSAHTDFARLGTAYADSVRRKAGGHRRFIDKMPLNFLYGGLIRLSLPSANIIHETRYAMDTCYAVFIGKWLHYAKWLEPLGNALRQAGMEES